MEEVNLISEISKDNATLAELRSKGGNPLDIQRITDRVRNNTEKLNKLREVPKQESFSESLNKRLDELGYSEDEIFAMSDMDKLEFVANNVTPEMRQFHRQMINEFSDIVHKEILEQMGFKNKKLADMSSQEMLTALREEMDLQLKAKGLTEEQIRGMGDSDKLKTIGTDDLINNSINRKIKELGYSDEDLSHLFNEDKQYLINNELDKFTAEPFLNSELRDLGYTELDIKGMGFTAKISIVKDRIFASMWEELGREGEILPEKPSEGGKGGVGVKEKVETKTEVKTKVKEETITEKQEVKPETEQKPTTKTETPTKETTTTETGEQVFLPDQTQLSDKIYALIWEDGKLHWAWIAPEPLQQGYIEIETKSGVANVPKEEYGRMTREQIERLYATEVKEEPTPSEFVAPFGEPSRQPQPSPEMKPLTESDFAKPEPIFVPTPVPITAPGYETPEPKPVPPPEPTPEPSPFTRTVTPPETITKERVVTRAGTIPSKYDKDSYEEQVAKILPGTAVWIQGRPKGSGDRDNVGMYRVLPPPYQQEDSFAMREPPPGYKDMGWSGKGMARQSLQIIGGTPDKDIEDIDLGWVRINIRVGGGKPEIEYVHDTEANVGQRNKTVGMGRGQIPIEAWEEAKARGVKYDEFIATYNGELVGGQKIEGNPIGKTSYTAIIPEENIQSEQTITVEQNPEIPKVQEESLKELVETESQPLTEIVEKEEPQEKSEIAQRMDDLIGLDDLLNDEPIESAEVEAPVAPSNATVVKSYVRRKKPSGKNWWESSYYQNPEIPRKKVDVSGITEPTYMGRRVLPPDLGSEL
jgi:hypothetical protein